MHSFASLVENYSTQVLNIALRVVGNRQAAQDVHQDVFMAVLRRWDKYDGSTNWGAYLYRAAIRKALDSVKRSKRTVVLSDYECRKGTASPEMAMIVTELEEKLRLALLKLPRRQSEVFVLSRMEGLRHEEISKITGCSQQTVRVHLHRALKRLAVEMGSYLE